MKGRFGTIALRGAASVFDRRTPTTLGVRFPEGDFTGAAGIYGSSIYDGAAGVGLALLDLHAAGAPARYGALADEVRDGLIESTPERGVLPAGLYTGYGGVALFHLAHARLRGDPVSLERAETLGARLAESPLTCADLLSGAAGVGLLALSLHHATGADSFLAFARRAATFLGDSAVRDGRGVAWPSEDNGETEMQPGLAHGVAGVCLFLIELSAVTRDERTRRLYEGGIRWLDKSAALARPDRILWPRSIGQGEGRHHWCHGSAGIAHTYLALHRRTGSRAALETATAAGNAAWSGARERGEPACHCHGAAGALDLFLSLFAHGAGVIWRERAEMLASLRWTRPGTAPSLGGTGAGLSVGTAGVVRELLRLAGKSVTSILMPMEGRVVLRAVRSFAKRSPTRKLALPRGDLRELLPPVAARVRGDPRWKRRRVVLGAPKATTTRAVLRKIGAAPAGAAYLESFERVRRACAHLRARHGASLGEGSLEPRALGLLLRELAGLSLQTDVDARRTIAVARRMTTNALRALELMVARVTRDMPHLLAGDVGGRITEIKVHGGDSHRGGHRVALLRFEDGPPLLYKARSLSIDRELVGASGPGEPRTLAERCRDWVVPAVEGGALPTHRIIPAGPWHGYAERLATESSPFASGLDLDLRGAPPGPTPAAQITQLPAGAARRYWYTAGLLSGHAFSFGVSDLHVENVVCGGSRSSPELALHAVDLEVAFGQVNGLIDTGLLEAPSTDVSSAEREHTHGGLDASFELTCGLHTEDWSLPLTGGRVSTKPELRRAVLLRFPHLARNPDGSFGYGADLCVFLRGMADQWWATRSHARAIAAHLRSSLEHAPVRVLVKQTRAYLAELDRRKSGGRIVAGAAVDPGAEDALPFSTAELTQLDDIDYPYFFRRLERSKRARPRTYWVDPASGRPSRAPELDSSWFQHEPFWSIVKRQSHPARFARALLDAVRAVAPAGPFDSHDRSLGIRATRADGDPRVVVVVLLGPSRDARLTCRGDAAGEIETHLD